MVDELEGVTSLMAKNSPKRPYSVQDPLKFRKAGGKGKRE